VDEVTCNVVPLNEYGMVLGSPNLYDRKAILSRKYNQYHLFKKCNEYVVHVHHIKENQYLVTMEQLKKATYSRKNVTPKLDDLKKESKMVVTCRSSHTFLQDEFFSCNLVEMKKHVGSFSIMFLIWLSLLIFSTWMVVGSERCEQMKMDNNMCSIIMIVLQLIMM
jgi:hypothetical protein